MRMYVFTNHMLRPIQQGIQGGHVMVEMAAKYYRVKGKERQKISDMFWDWATNHKTVIFCNAGFQQGVESWEFLVTHGRHPYPYAVFKEDEETLGGLTTAVGIVLPEVVYSLAQDFQEGATITGFTPFEMMVAEKLSTTRLAT